MLSQRIILQKDFLKYLLLIAISWRIIIIRDVQANIFRLIYLKFSILVNFTFLKHLLYITY